MYVLTKKQTRPNQDVKFFDIRNVELVNKEYRDYWRATYVATNKCIFVQHNLSPDQLEMTSVMMWESKTDYEAFIADQTSLDEFLNKYTAYNTTHNIITETVNEEEI
jgi:hypothetical protein